MHFDLNIKKSNVDWKILTPMSYVFVIYMLECIMLKKNCAKTDQISIACSNIKHMLNVQHPLNLLEPQKKKPDRSVLIPSPYNSPNKVSLDLTTEGPIMT